MAAADDIVTKALSLAESAYDDLAQFAARDHVELQRALLRVGKAAQGLNPGESPDASKYWLAVMLVQCVRDAASPRDR